MTWTFSAYQSIMPLTWRGSTSHTDSSWTGGRQLFSSFYSNISVLGNVMYCATKSVFTPYLAKIQAFLFLLNLSHPFFPQWFSLQPISPKTEKVCVEKVGGGQVATAVHIMLWLPFMPPSQLTQSKHKQTTAPHDITQWVVLCLKMGRICEL